MVKLLLAGTGLIGHRHMQHILAHPDFELVGIVDPIISDKKIEGVKTYKSLNDVDTEAEGIILATPTDTHADLTIQSLKMGMHVLVEKPVAASLQEADQMIHASEKTGLSVLVGHHRRHHPVVSETINILNSGRIGRPVATSLMWLMRKQDEYFDVDWRKGIDGGPVKQNLIHDVDTLRAFFGEIISVVGSGTNIVRNAKRHENGGVVLSFDTGMVATITFSDATPTPWGFEAGTGESPYIPKTNQSSMFIAGTNGGLEFPTLKLWGGASNWNEKPIMERQNIPEAVPLIRQLEHFSDVIKGKATPVVDARSARETLAVILQIEQATMPTAKFQ
jgi:predicted dehydrogenase